MGEDRGMRSTIVILLSLVLLTILFVGAAVLLGYGRHQFRPHHDKLGYAAFKLHVTCGLARRGAD
jgi:hypothetical protein